MSLDHEAIRKAYPNAVTIDDGTGAFDASGNSITLDNSLVTAARTYSPFWRTAASTLYLNYYTNTTYTMTSVMTVTEVAA